MTQTSDYLLLSRGHWDRDKTPEQIQDAIDRFYVWYEGNLAAGTFKPGQRLATGGKVVSRGGVVDGPFAEAKEIIGGYWIIVAPDLDKAAAIAAQNPCLECGLTYEVRPIEEDRASAYREGNETPKS
jgi:hypothetical protein